MPARRRRVSTSWLAAIAAPGALIGLLIGAGAPSDSSKTVSGRPVGVTVGKDGSLFVTEDGSGTIWRVAHAARGVSPAAGTH
jgi:hypothetical protein